MTAAFLHTSTTPGSPGAGRAEQGAWPRLHPGFLLSQKRTHIHYTRPHSSTAFLLTLVAPGAVFALLFDLEDYATTYRATRDAYLKAANELKLATGPYKAARDAYVAATATYTKSLYE
jgi:hypothetical protein